MNPVRIEVLGFVFDTDNTPHIARHGVDEIDLAEVLENAPQFFENPAAPGLHASHVMLGPTRAGRFVFAAIVEAGDGKWRPITA